MLIAFTRQRWLRERTAVLRYTYIACLAIPRHVHLYGLAGVQFRCAPAYAYSLRHKGKNIFQNFVEVLAQIALINNKGAERCIP